MIDKFCDFLILKIKNKVENLDEEKEMVIDFGVRLLFGELPKIFLLIIIGFICKVGWYTVLMFLLIAPFRSFTGGFHLRTHLGCMITTTLLYMGPIVLAKVIPIPLDYLKYIMAGIVAIFAIILISKYAPADTENIPIISKKERKSKKIKSYLSLAILVIIAVLVPDQIITYMLLYGIFIQSLTITPIAYFLTKSKYGYEIYQEKTI